MGADGLAKDNGFLPASTDEVLKRSKQLELNEDFRRAARNSMIWSLLALIAGIGRASGAEVNVTFLGAGLTFGQSTLAAGALIGAGFMFLAYFRAYQRFRNQNNELAFDVAAGEMIKAVKALNVIAEEARAEVVSAAKSAEQLQLETVQYMNEFKRRGQSLVKPPRIGDVLRQIKAATPMYSLEYGPSGYPHPRSVRQAFMEVIGNYILDFTDGAGRLASRGTKPCPTAAFATKPQRSTSAGLTTARRCC